MKKEQLLFVPLVGKTSACRQKEGLKLIENLPLLPRLTAVLPPQGREIARGFTLIELLVVVLIIGILAAVALPQYQLAVAKSRYAKVKPLVESIAQAQELYYLANGEYPTKLEELDISFPAGGRPQGDTGFYYEDMFCNTGAGRALCRVYLGGDEKSLEDVAYSVTAKHYEEDKYPAGIRFCTVFETSSVAEKICQLETGKQSPDKVNGPQRTYYY